MSSFKETKSLLQDQKMNDAFFLRNKNQLSRVYPNGTRINSSNYDPCPYWMLGFQLVALNFQTAGRLSLM